MTGGSEGRSLWHGRTLALVGIVIVAFNLRTAVASLAPVINLMEKDIPLPSGLVGFLGMLPPLCYALFGILTPMVARRWQLEPTLIGALAVLVAGLIGRGISANVVGFLFASTAVFAALGVGNVLLPPLVKRYFPDRIGLMTTAYVTAMSISTFVPPLIAVPVAQATNWRLSLAQWAIVAGTAIVPWVMLLVHPRRNARDAHPEEQAPGILRTALRSPIAWALMILLAVSGFNAYTAFAWLPQILHDIAGSTPVEAGALLSLYAALGLPTGVIVPVIVARFGAVRTMVGVAVAAYIIGYLGLLLIPQVATWLWVALAGIGPLTFPLALVLINLRSRTHSGAVALSGFVQSFGYVIVALGPLAVGLLHDTTGDWTIPLWVLLASTAMAIVAGTIAAKPRFIEDESHNANP